MISCKIHTHAYIYIYIYTGQMNYSNFEYSNIPGKELKVNELIVLIIFFHTKKIIRALKFFWFKKKYSDIEVANFLDVKLNLSDNTYRQFLKTEQYPSYINVNSDHSNSLIK